VTDTRRNAETAKIAEKQFFSACPASSAFPIVFSEEFHVNSESNAERAETAEEGILEIVPNRFFSASSACSAFLFAEATR
jgi:hypothetical protein